MSNNGAGGASLKCLPPIMILLCVAAGLLLPVAVMRFAPISKAAIAPSLLPYVLTGAGEILAIGIPALLLSRYYFGGKKWLKRLYSRRPAPLKLVLTAASALTLPCFSGALTMLWISLIGLANDIPQLRLPWDGAGAALAILCAAVLPAVCEETLFRGVMFEWLSAKTCPKIAVYLTAAVFALLHFTWAGLPALFVIGILLGKIRLRFGSLILPALYHALYNLGALCLYEVLGKMDTGSAMLLVLTSFVLFIPVTVLLLKDDGETTPGAAAPEPF